MLIVSSKKDLWENPSFKQHSFAKKENFLDFDVDSELAVDDTAYAKITKKSFKKRIKGKRVLLLIHGYNLDFLDVLASYSTLHQNIQQELSHPELSHYHEVIGYTWHVGKHDVDDAKFSYAKAKRNAKKASKRLHKLLQKTLKNATSIDVISHSLGSRVLLTALADHDKTSSKQTSKKPLIRNHFCVAAAVNNSCFQKGKHLRNATKQTEATWIFYSKNDASLQTKKLLAKSNSAMGLTGPKAKKNKLPKRTASIDCSSFIYSHGAYKRVPIFYSCLGDILEGRMDVREKVFELEPTSTTSHTTSRL